MKVHTEVARQREQSEDKVSYRGDERGFISDDELEMRIQKRKPVTRDKALQTDIDMAEFVRVTDEKGEAVEFHDHYGSNFHADNLILEKEQQESWGCLYCDHCHQQAQQLMQDRRWRPRPHCSVCHDLERQNVTLPHQSQMEHKAEYQQREGALRAITTKSAMQEMRRHRLMRENRELREIRESLVETNKRQHATFMSVWR